MNHRPILALTLLASIGCQDRPAPSATNAARDGSASTRDASAMDFASDASLGRRARSVSEDAGAMDAAALQDVAPAPPRPTAWPFSARATRVDVDHDGRLDWVSAVDADDEEMFLAHAVSEREASLDDELARAFVRARCPHSDAPLVVMSTYDPDEPESFVNDASDLARRTICMRVWGRTPAQVRQWIRSHRAQLAKLHTGDDAREDAVEQQIAALDRLAAERPPLLLQPSSPALPVSWPRDAGAPDAGEPDAGEPDASALDGGASDPRFALRRADARVRRRCARYAAQIAPRVRHALDELARRAEREQPAESDLLERVGRCIDAEGGAWIIDIVSVRADSSSDVAKTNLHWAPRWLGNDGSDLRFATTAILEQTSCDHDTIEVFGATDYDGDGRGELVLGTTHFWCGDGDGDDAGPVQIFTVRAGAGEDGGGTLSAQRFATNVNLERVTSAADFDHDGRVDLFDARWYGQTSCDPAAVGTDEYDVWPVALHSRPDGTFAYDDAATRRWTAEQCAQTRRSFAFESDGAEVLSRALCARFAGWSADRILAAVGATRSGYTERCNELRWVRDLLLVRSPFVTPVPETMR